MSRSQQVYDEVNALYEANLDHPMGVWMWSNHVQWVANKAKELASKYEADKEKVYCAALLHDLADCIYERTHKEFDSWSEQKGFEILIKAGFDDAIAAEIIEIIVRPHSCRPDNLPTTIEGKVLATADAMFHMQTSFFPLFSFNHKPQDRNTYSEWQDWFDEKIERDYGPKIFFEEERAEVASEYQSLKKVFGNRTLPDPPQE